VSYAGDLIDDRIKGWEVGHQLEVIVVAHEVELHHTGVATHLESAPVTPILQRLHPRSEAGPEVIHEGETVEGTGERQAQTQAAIGGEDVVPATFRSERAGCEAENLFHHAPHLAHAPEPRSRGDSGHSQIGLIEQAAGEMGPAGTGNEVWSGSDMLLEEASELPCGVANSHRESVFVEAIEKPRGYQSDGTRNGEGGVGDLDRSQVTVGAAPQTGSVSGRFGSDRCGVGRNIPDRGSSGALGPAVDACGGYGGYDHDTEYALNHLTHSDTRIPPLYLDPSTARQTVACAHLSSRSVAHSGRHHTR